MKAMTTKEASQVQQELSNDELDAIVGGTAAVVVPVARPKEYLTINLENTMVSG
jgi:bacteriocin-like protein